MKFAHALVGFVREWIRQKAILMVGFCLATVSAVVTGPDLNFDLRNIRAYNAWMILRGRLDDDPISNLLSQYLPFHDIANVILIGTGHWWLPVLFWGSIQASTIFVAYRLATELAPNISEPLRQLTAVTSLASPLIMMELGTSFGDLTAAPFLGLMVLTCLNKRDSWNWCSAGVLLAIAAVVKPTVVLGVPPVLFGLSIVAFSGTQIVTFLLGFFGVYFSLGLVWALYWSSEANIRYLSMPGLPIAGLEFVLLALISLIGLIGTTVPAARKVLQRVDTQLSRRRHIWTLRVGIFTALAYQGRKWHSEFLVSGAGTDGAPGASDWMVKNVAEFGRRMFHTGALSDGYRLLDLEMPYRDFRVPFGVVVMIGALVSTLVHVFRDRYGQFKFVLGTAVALLAPIFFMIWIVGYARYFVQYLPFVPVLAMAVVSGVNWSVKGRAKNLLKIGAVGAVVIASIFAVLPVRGGTPYVEKFAQTESTGALLSSDEADILNALIGPNSTVHIAGILVSSAAVFLNRPDVSWTYAIPTVDELKQQKRKVLYSPQWQKGMIALREAGARTENCSILRFRYVVYGICDLSA